MRPIKRRQPACSPHDIRASLCCWAFLISGRLTGASGVLQFGINATCLAGVGNPFASQLCLHIGTVARSLFESRT